MFFPVDRGASLCLYLGPIRTLYPQRLLETPMVQGSFPKRACVVCGGPIPEARLRALVKARTCISCQRELESSKSAPEDVAAAGYGTSQDAVVQPIEVKEDRIVAGAWSGNLMEVVGKGGEFRSLLRSGKREEARSLVQSLPNEAQAALVTFDENPEEALSLTAMDGQGRPAYRQDVVAFLPSELLASLVAYKPEEKEFNDRLIRAMSPDAFKRTLDETLEPVDNQSQRIAILWEWLEAVAAMDDYNHRASLIRSVEGELLMEALIDKVSEIDLMAVFSGVSVFKFFSKDSAVGVLPSTLVDDPNTGAVLDAVYEAAPDVLRTLVRIAHEKSGVDS
jgi:hypothetical protein